MHLLMIGTVVKVIIMGSVNYLVDWLSFYINSKHFLEWSCLLSLHNSLNWYMYDVWVYIFIVIFNF